MNRLIIMFCLLAPVITFAQVANRIVDGSATYIYSNGAFYGTASNVSQNARWDAALASSVWAVASSTTNVFFRTGPVLFDGYNNYVGIGTNVPARILHVHAGAANYIKVSSSESSDLAGLDLHGGDVAGDDVGSHWLIQTEKNGRLRWYDYTNYRMTLNTNGLVIAKTDIGADFPLQVMGSNGAFSAYFAGEISVADVVERTSVWTPERGSALSQLKTSKDLVDGDGKIDHTKYASYEQRVIRPEYTDSNGVVHAESRGISMSERSAKHEQALFELLAIITNLQARINKLEGK